MDANTRNRDVLPDKVRLTLDPEVANVELLWERGDSNRPFRIVRDPNNYVILESNKNDVEEDVDTHVLRLNFRVMFNWSWPHEDPSDVDIQIDWLDGLFATYTMKDIFIIENDLDFVGMASATGEWQGPLSEGDWVRGGENLTVSSPLLVYEDTTDVFPHSGIVNIQLIDDDGDFTTQPQIHGFSVKLNITADNVTDLDELFTLTIIDLPDNCELRTEPTYRLRVDATPPEIVKMLPDGDDWHSSSTIHVLVVATDNTTSGVDADALEYSYSTEGPMSFGQWTNDGLGINILEFSVEGLVVLTLQDGDDNFVRWLISDIVGNVAPIQETRIKVDTRNVTYADPTPQGWQNIRRFSCGVLIHDVEGSGIDVSSIQYRISHNNISQYGQWTDWDEDTIDDLITVSAWITAEFPETAYNYIQWRAEDIAGNGLTDSPHYQIRVDTTPINFTMFCPAPDVYQTKRVVACSVIAQDKPGGSGVNLSSIEYRYRPSGGRYTQWTSLDLDGCEIKKELNLNVELTDGNENMIQFRGLDLADNIPTLSHEYRVRVDSTGPEFIKILPLPGDKQADRQVMVTVSIKDELSGVDSNRLYCSYGTESEANSDEWLDVELVQEGDTFIGKIILMLEKGKSNLVSFKAYDMAGNEHVSNPSTIWVNSPPIAHISSPAEGEYWDDMSPVVLNASGTEDPDGDSLNYTWMLEGYSGPLAYGLACEVTLTTGNYNLTLVVKDDVGAEDRITRTLIVEHNPPRTESRDNDWLWVLLIFFVAVILSLMYIFRKRSSVAMRKDE